MPSSYYYIRQGQQHGPVSVEQLRELATTGRLSASDNLWTEGQADWMPAGKLQGLFPAPIPMAVPEGKAQAPYPDWLKKPVVWMSGGGAALAILILVLVIALWPKDKEPTPSGSSSGPADITGAYKVEGSGETITITKKGDVYNVKRDHASGSWPGVGIRQGDILSVAWHKSDGTTLGVSVFKIGSGEKGPRLQGQYTTHQSEQIKTETLAFDKKAEGSGSSGTPVVNVPAGKPVEVTCAQLLKDFRPAATGNAKYKDKLLKVTDALFLLGDDQGIALSNLENIMKDGGQATIVCRFKASDAAKVAKLQPGRVTKVTGRLNPDGTESGIAGLTFVVIVLEDCTFEQ